MLRSALVFLAKKGPASQAPRKKVLKRLGRSGSRGAAKRRPGPAKHKSSAASAASSSASGLGRGGKGSASSRGAGGSGSEVVDASALVHVSSEEGRTPPATAHTPVAVSRAMTYRLATAVSTVVVPPLANAYLESMKQTLTPAVRRAQDGGIDGGSAAGPVSQMEEYYTSKKGPLFATAVIAGTNAVKQASTLIPFCHPIPIQKCSFTFRRRAVGSTLNHSALPHRVVLRKRSSAPSPRPSKPEYSVLYCFCTVATEEYKTGVEMEALTGATVAAMTLYDMLRSLPGAQEDGLALGESFVLAKRGGRNDFIKLLMSEPDQPQQPPKATPALTDTPAATDDDNITATAAAAATGQPLRRPDDATTAADDAADEYAEGESARDRSASGGRPVVTKRSPMSASATPQQDEAAGDEGAWWRTSRQEKRLQELYPRRKYGDGARLAPNPTSAELRGKTKQAQHDDEEGEGEYEEEEEDVVGKAPSARSHGKAGAATTQRKKASAATVVEKADELAEDEDEEEDVEEEVVVAPSKTAKRKPRSGQLAKKSSRGAPARAQADDDEDEDADEAERMSAAEEEPADVDDDEDEDEVVVRPPSPKKTASKKKPAPKIKKTSSKAAAARARARQQQEAEEDEDADDDDAYGKVDDDEEEEPAPPTRGKAAARKSAARSSTRHRQTAAEEEVDEDAHDDDGDDEDEDEVVSISKYRKARPVRHDSWDNQTQVYEADEDDTDAAAGHEDDDEEDEAPPPSPAKKLKKKRRAPRRS